MSAILAPRLPFRQVAPERAGRGVLALLLACFALCALISLTGYLQYKSTGFDLSIFDQAIRAYSHFRAPVSDVKAPGYNILGDHFHPILILLAPLYWTWDNPCVLLITQAALISLSVPIVYRFARRRTTTHRYALFLAGVYAFGWPIWSMANFDFHEVAFAVPILAATIDALDRRDTRRTVLWAALLLLVKEDLGIVVIAIGLLAGLGTARGVLRRRGSRPALGLLLVGVGAGAYLVTTEVLIPLFAPGHRFSYWQYTALGANLPDALATIVTHPWHAAVVFVLPSSKAFTLGLLLLPLAGLSLRSPYALVALPLLAERFFNSRRQLWSTSAHYNALPWLVLALACIDGMALLGLLADTPRATHRRTLLGIWFVLTGLIAVLCTVQIENWIKPGGGLISRLAQWNNATVRNQAAADAQVPDNVCVEADNFLVTHLTPRDYVTLPGAAGIHPDYILLDLRLPVDGPSQTVPGADGPRTRDVLAGALRDGYTIIWQRGTIDILRSPDYTGPSAQCTPLGPGRQSTPDFSALSR